MPAPLVSVRLPLPALRRDERRERQRRGRARRAGCVAQADEQALWGRSTKWDEAAPKRAAAEWIPCALRLLGAA